MFKKFTEYARMREQEEGGPEQGAPKDPPSDSSDQDSKGDDNLLAAIKVAMTKFRPQVEKFLGSLAAQDEEVKAALSGNNSSVQDSDSGDSEGEDVVPTSADASV